VITRHDCIVDSFESLDTLFNCLRPSFTSLKRQHLVSSVPRESVWAVSFFGARLPVVPDKASVEVGSCVVSTGELHINIPYANQATYGPKNQVVLNGVFKLCILTVMVATVPVKAKMLPSAISFCWAEHQRDSSHQNPPPKNNGVQSILRANWA